MLEPRRRPAGVLLTVGRRVPSSVSASGTLLPFSMVAWGPARSAQATVGPRSLVAARFCLSSHEGLSDAPAGIGGVDAPSRLAPCHPGNATGWGAAEPGPLLEIYAFRETVMILISFMGLKLCEGSRKRPPRPPPSRPCTLGSAQVSPIFLPNDPRLGMGAQQRLFPAHGRSDGGTAVCFHVLTYWS